MADPDDKSPAAPDKDRLVHQGEPTYGPDDISEGARRSLWREQQRYEDTGWLARRTLGPHQPADEIGPSVGTTGQGQYGAGGFADGGYGQSGYGADYGQSQHGQDSFGGEERARSVGEEGSQAETPSAPAGPVPDVPAAASEGSEPD